MGLTAWAQEAEDKRKAWFKIERLEKELEASNKRVEELDKEVERLCSIFHKFKKEKENAIWESDTIFAALMTSSNAYLVEEGLSSKEWFTKHVEYSIEKFALDKKIEALSKFEPISGAVANHWCDKEQAGYFWLHSELMAELKRLKQMSKDKCDVK